MTGGMMLTDEAATARVGASIADVIRVGDVITLSGPLGAGKTSLARGLLAALGLAGDVPSPTFPIVIAYPADEVRVPVWHVDLYRIEDAEEMAELGLDQARDEAALLVEWPERSAADWADALQLTIAPEPRGGRRLTWAAPAAWESRWPPAR